MRETLIQTAEEITNSPAVKKQCEAYTKDSKMPESMFLHMRIVSKMFKKEEG